MKAKILSGVDNLSSVEKQLKGRRIGLMTNPTGIDQHFRSTIDLLHETYGLTALFSAEHGVRGDAQAGDVVETYQDPDTGVTVYSVYGKSDRMSAEMLDTFDVLVFDMQDVGVRFYTYLYSLAYAMEACAQAGKSVVVLDRINPIGGVKRGGTILDLRFRSFVGDYELPTQTGITIGEYARYVKEYLKLDLDLTVVPLSGWRRELYLEDTSLPWVAPSPNCQSYVTALVYPGTCVFEGTNLSEGRGTTQPFEWIGAPWIHAAELEKRMAAQNLPGVHFRRASFRPTFSKHAGTVCHGVQMHVLDRERMNAFWAGLRLLDTIRALHPDQFEFVSWDGGESYAIDKLLGTDRYRVGGENADDLLASYAPQVEAFSQGVAPFLLYS